jgi:hypothetical protein
MRGLKRLIPDDVRDSLNANPAFQWLVVVLMVIVGVFFVVQGINGVKTKRITGKRGRVFEGRTAQILGVIYVILGALLAVVAVGVKLTL